MRYLALIRGSASAAFGACCSWRLADCMHQTKCLFLSVFVDFVGSRMPVDWHVCLDNVYQAFYFTNCANRIALDFSDFEMSITPDSAPMLASSSSSLWASTSHDRFIEASCFSSWPSLPMPT